MAEPIEFETERLRLRQWRRSDFDPFAALNADPRVMEFFPAPLTKSESDELAERCRSSIAERGWGFWAVEIKDAAPFVGFVGLSIPRTPLPFSPCVEIGWRLGFQHWNRGYASEAARAALRIAFERIGVDEIVSFTAILNVRSQAVMRRIGMHETREDFDHPSVAEGSPLRRHRLYRLSREQWERRALPVTSDG